MTIGFTCGVFDLLHTGHLTFLQACKDKCTHLIVGLQTDPTIDRKEKNKPIQSVFERYIQLSLSKPVDQIIPYDSEKDLENLLSIYKINIRFIGMDHYGKPITGEDLCKKLNLRISYIERDYSYSSSELRERVYVAEKLKRIK